MRFGRVRKPEQLPRVRISALHPLPYFLTFLRMLAKLTAKNQLTLPKRAIEALGSPTDFRVEVAEGRITLTPARLDGADAVRAKLAELDITDADVIDAVTWARRPR
jgi:hypothetical protein